MNYYEIDENLFQNVLGYLATRPYQEVVILMNILINSQPKQRETMNEGGQADTQGKNNKSVES